IRVLLLGSVRRDTRPSRPDRPGDHSGDRSCGQQSLQRIARWTSTLPARALIQRHTIDARASGAPTDLPAGAQPAAPDSSQPVAAAAAAVAAAHLPAEPDLGPRHSWTCAVRGRPDGQLRIPVRVLAITRRPCTPGA